MGAGSGWTASMALLLGVKLLRDLLVRRHGSRQRAVAPLGPNRPSAQGRERARCSGEGHGQLSLASLSSLLGVFSVWEFFQKFGVSRAAMSLCDIELERAPTRSTFNRR